MKLDGVIQEVKTLNLGPSDALIVKLPDGTTQATLSKFREYLTTMLETQKVVVYASDNIEFLKVRLEEHLIDELVEKELRK